MSRGLPPDEPARWLWYLQLAQIGLAFTGTRLLGREWLSDVALLYAIVLLVPLQDEKFRRELLRGTLREYAIKFTAGFLVTLMLFWGLWLEVLRLPVGKIGYSSVWPMIVLQLVFVAPVEEILFRGWVVRMLDPKGRTWVIYAKVSIGGVLASLLFSAFHYGAYGSESIAPYAIVFILAMVWTWASRIEVGWPFHESDRAPLGVPFTIGSHFAWNLCVIGILTGGVLLGT